MSQPRICIVHDLILSWAGHHDAKIYLRLDNCERVCETERFPTRGETLFRWCVERLHDRPFQDFVAHETHRLMPGDSPFHLSKNREAFLSKKTRRSELTVRTRPPRFSD